MPGDNAPGVSVSQKRFPANHSAVGRAAPAGTRGTPDCAKDASMIWPPRLSSPQPYVVFGKLEKKKRRAGQGADVLLIGQDELRFGFDAVKKFTVNS